MSITFDTFCHNVIFNTKILCRYRGKLVCMQRGNRNCAKQRLHIVLDFYELLHAHITRDADCYGQKDERGDFLICIYKEKNSPQMYWRALKRMLPTWGWIRKGNVLFFKSSIWLAGTILLKNLPMHRKENYNEQLCRTYRGIEPNYWGCQYTFRSARFFLDIPCNSRQHCCGTRCWGNQGTLFCATQGV